MFHFFGQNIKYLNNFGSENVPPTTIIFYYGAFLRNLPGNYGKSLFIKSLIEEIYSPNNCISLWPAFLIVTISSGEVK